METRYYEGCGIEGPIRCIFLAEFHPVMGPKITCQFPEDYISKEVFDAISAYIIPKAQIHRCNMTINACGHKVIGYPIKIENAKYERNGYLFNLCFVCDSWSKSVQYEPVVKKLGEHLMLMEEQSQYVSKGTAKFPTLMAHLLHDLNTHRKATIVEGETVMNLKVLEVHKDPPHVDDHDVPVIISSVGLPQPPSSCSRREVYKEGCSTNEQKSKQDEVFCLDYKDDDWDLTTRQILPFVDGYNHISKIAAEANIEKTLVKACIQNLIYYDVVSVSDLLKILCAMQQGTTLSAICERFPATKNGILDIRRLVVFAEMHGLIRCVQRYPVYTGERINSRPSRTETAGIRAMFTGRHTVEEICTKARISLPMLEEIIEEDPNIVCSTQLFYYAVNEDGN